MGIKEFANKFIEKQKESNKKIKESFNENIEKNKMRTEATKLKIEERKRNLEERDLEYKAKQELYKLKREEFKEERREIVENIKQISNSKKDINKHLKEEEKERKRKEFEKIMASNPQVRTKSSAIDKNKEAEDNIVVCPKCGSKSITAQKKGFGLAKGAAGVFVAGAYGVVAAGIGKNKILITCLNCGHRWKPGKK